MAGDDPGAPDPAPDTAPRHASAYRARHSRRAPRRRHGRLRRWPRRVLVVCNILVLVLIASAATVAGYAWYELGRINRITIHGIVPEGKGSQSRSVDHSPPFTVLIIGSDTRDLKKATGLDIGNTGSNSENLSDSIILARVNPATRHLALLSIPRDLFVSIPGLGDQKINAAFAGGNASRLIAVIRSDLGIQINHFAEVNFDSFEEIADTVGGVEQYFPTPAKDLESDLRLHQAGCVLLKGAQALAFVRSRNYQYFLDGQWNLQLEPESDLGRIQRQQAFIKNAIVKAEHNGDLTNPATLASIIGSITSNLTVDSTFSDHELISLAEDLSHVNANTIPDLTYPTENIPSGSGVSPGLEKVPAADARVVAEFLADNGMPKTASPAPSTTTTSVPGTSTSTSSTSTTIPHSGITVEVENGSGAVGQASAAASALTGAGFSVSGTTDAASYDHPSNVVEYGPDGLPAARTLEASLAGGATLVEDTGLSGSSLVLVTGTDYAGISSAPGSGGSTTTTTVPATTTTTAPADGSPYQSATAIIPSSSSFFHGVYIPPGRVAGQAVTTCGD